MKLEISIKEFDRIVEKLDKMFEIAFKQGYLTGKLKDET